MCVPVRPSPSTTQVSRITQYHSEKRADMGVFCTHLISWPQASPQCPGKDLMYHAPGSLWVSYGVPQKLRQTHSQVFHLYLSAYDPGAISVIRHMYTEDAGWYRGFPNCQSLWCLYKKVILTILLMFGWWKEQLCTNFQIPGCSAHTGCWTQLRASREMGRLARDSWGHWTRAPQPLCWTGLHNTWIS